MQVKQATLIAFQNQPDVFYMSNVYFETWSLLRPKKPTDATISRQLRKLRAVPNGEVNYEVINNSSAKYRKLK